MELKFDLCLIRQLLSSTVYGFLFTSEVQFNRTDIYIKCLINQLPRHLPALFCMLSVGLRKRSIV